MAAASDPWKDMRKLAWELPYEQLSALIQAMIQEQKKMKDLLDALGKCKQRLIDEIPSILELPDIITKETMRSLHHRIFQGGKFPQAILEQEWVGIELLYVVPREDGRWMDRWDMFIKEIKDITEPPPERKPPPASSSSSSSSGTRRGKKKD